MAYTSGVARRFITVAETPLFIRQSQDIWDDAEREAFIDFISRNPERGPEAANAAAHGWSTFIIVATARSIC
jgi:hypothetical protein